MSRQISIYSSHLPYSAIHLRDNSKASLTCPTLQNTKLPSRRPRFFLMLLVRQSFQRGICHVLFSLFLEKYLTSKHHSLKYISRSSINLQAFEAYMVRHYGPQAQSTPSDSLVLLRNPTWLYFFYRHIML